MNFIKTTSGPKISGRTVFFEIVGPGGPKFSAKISVRDLIFQDQNSRDRSELHHRLTCRKQCPDLKFQGGPYFSKLFQDQNSSD